MGAAGRIKRAFRIAEPSPPGRYATTLPMKGREKEAVYSSSSRSRFNASAA